jgi:antirestriction protein ArdC
MSTHDLITERILLRLAHGVVPWHQPWDAGLPRHVVSRQPSRGMNVILTESAGFASPDWLTFHQAHALGGSVQKGARGTPVVVWTWFEVDGEGAAIDPRRVPLLRSYAAFTLEQTTGIGTPVDPDTPAFQPIACCEAVVAQRPQRPRIQHGAARACDSPQLDVVHMPQATWFEAPEAYYSTLFHELIHRTGHAGRLNRATLTDPCSFGSPTSSKAELVAEMGVAFLCGMCGIENRTVDNSAAYIASWWRVLEQEIRMVIVAAAQAQQAADSIQGVVPVEPDA